LVCPWVKMVS